VYAEQASRFLEGKVDFVINEHTGHDPEAFEYLSKQYPSVRFRIWVNIAGEDYFVCAVSSDSSVAVGERYVYSETRGWLKELRPLTWCPA